MLIEYSIHPKINEDTNSKEYHRVLSVDYVIYIDGAEVWRDTDPVIEGVPQFGEISAQARVISYAKIGLEEGEETVTIQRQTCYNCKHNEVQVGVPDFGSTHDDCETMSYGCNLPDHEMGYDGAPCDDWEKGGD